MEASYQGRHGRWLDAIPVKMKDPCDDNLGDIHLTYSGVVQAASLLEATRQQWRDEVA